MLAAIILEGVGEAAKFSQRSEAFTLGARTIPAELLSGQAAHGRCPALPRYSSCTANKHRC